MKFDSDISKLEKSTEEVQRAIILLAENESAVEILTDSLITDIELLTLYRVKAGKFDNSLAELE